MERQREFEIREGGYYMGDGKECLIRHVTYIHGEGRIALCLWESYYTRTGEATRDSGECIEKHLKNWAGREATPEEIARLRKTEPAFKEEQ
jgi:hypothetical protein